MDANGISNHAGAARKDGALPGVARAAVHVLLVARCTTFLMSLASQFEEQLYEVTTTESAKIALALLEQRRNYYDIIITDVCIPEMGISEFVEKLHGQRMTVPIILIAEESTMDLAREAIGNDVCYIFPNPPSLRDISNAWQHIPRVTGEIPAALSVMNQIAENPDSSNDAPEEDAHNAKKPRLSWTPHLEDKFLRAINILGGERGARPRTILRLMNQPGLTPRHIASHLQKYRRQRRRSLNLQETASPVMPPVPHAATVKNYNLGEGTTTSGSDQQFDGMPSNDDMNQFMQDFDISEGGGDMWDWFN